MHVSGRKLAILLLSLGSVIAADPVPAPLPPPSIGIAGLITRPDSTETGGAGDSAAKEHAWKRFIAPISATSCDKWLSVSAAAGPIPADVRGG